MGFNFFETLKGVEFLFMLHYEIFLINALKGCFHAIN